MRWNILLTSRTKQGRKLPLAHRLLLQGVGSTKQWENGHDTSKFYKNTESRPTKVSRATLCSVLSNCGTFEAQIASVFGRTNSGKLRTRALLIWAESFGFEMQFEAVNAFGVGHRGKTKARYPESHSKCVRFCLYVKERLQMASRNAR